ncbi:DUF1616 domain-containing protein, partial [Chloroflexota bacterium]
MLKIRIRNELVLLDLLVLVLIISTVLLPSNPIRIVLGVPFVLFFTGYAFIAALFPERERMNATERIALSFAMSIVIVPLIGVILGHTALGLRLEPILYSVSSFILITSIIAWIRRKQLPEQKRFGIEFQLTSPNWGESVRDKVLSIALAVTIMGALGVLGYVIATPETEEQFTEFYVVGVGGNGRDYPSQFVLGEADSVTLRVVNREQQAVSYHLEVRIDNVIIDEIGPATLEYYEVWESVA